MLLVLLASMTFIHVLGVLFFCPSQRFGGTPFVGAGLGAITLWWRPMTVAPCRSIVSDTKLNNLESFPLLLLLVGTDPLVSFIPLRQCNAISLEAVGTSKLYFVTASLPERHHKLLGIVGRRRVESVIGNACLEHVPVIEN